MDGTELINMLTRHNNALLIIGESIKILTERIDDLEVKLAHIHDDLLYKIDEE